MTGSLLCAGDSTLETIGQRAVSVDPSWAKPQPSRATLQPTKLAMPKKKKKLRARPKKVFIYLLLVDIPINAVHMPLFGILTGK